jgi:hypothetical protein
MNDQPRRSERVAQNVVRLGSTRLAPRLDAAGFAQFKQSAREAGGGSNLTGSFDASHQPRPAIWKDRSLAVVVGF